MPDAELVPERVRLPARIAALEEEHQRLKEETASPQFYRGGVLARAEAVQRDLDVALQRWVERESLTL